VDKDANLDVTARRLVWGKFINCGQTCISADYVIVHPKVEEALIAKMKEAMKKFYGPDPKKSPDYSRIVNVNHLRRLKGLLEDGKFEVVTGGEIDEAERYFAPTIVRDVKQDSKLMEDEIFGPIMPILSQSLFNPDQFLDSAIKFIKKLPKPLGGYIFTGSSATAKKFTEEVPFGGGCINDLILHGATPNLPFGGVGESGIGSYHGKAGFERLSHHKSILHNTTMVDPFLRYPPYTARGVHLMNTLKKLDPSVLLLPAVILAGVVLAYFAPEKPLSLIFRR